VADRADDLGVRRQRDRPRRADRERLWLADLVLHRRAGDPRAHNRRAKSISDDRLERKRAMRVVVIGSGLMGVASAYFLAREGCEVLVIDRESAPALGTSHANAGMLTPSMADPWNSPGVFWHLLKWIGKEDAPFLLRP